MIRIVSRPESVLAEIVTVFCCKLGLLLDYPNGETEEIEISTDEIPWTKVEKVGTWFPDAFIGTMSSLQRFAAGEDEDLPHSVENAFHTMAVVYACLESDSKLGTLIKKN